MLSHFEFLQGRSARAATQDPFQRWLLRTNAGGTKKAQLPFQSYTNAGGIAMPLMAQMEKTKITCL